MKNKASKLKKENVRRTDNRIDRFFGTIDNLIRSKISSNIQLELIFAVAFCLVLAFLAYNITFNMTRQVSYQQGISYDDGIYNISTSANEIAERMLNDLRYKEEDIITDEMRDNARYSSESDPNVKQFDLSIAVNNLINDFSRSETLKVIVTDLGGNIKFKTANVPETQIDVFNVIKSVYDIDYYNSNSENSEAASEMTFVYPMNFLKDDIYLIIKDTPQAVIQTSTTYEYNSSIALLVALLFFVAGFMILTKNKMDYIQELSNTVRIISTGNLKYTAPVKGNDELTHLAKSINVMAKDIDMKIEEERKVEKTKQDLITNVSHDLRTPLTSIIGYLGLAQSENITDSQRADYISIAYSKSERLKELINELFEYTKLQSPENLKEISTVNLRELLDQLVEEMSPMTEENNLEIQKIFTKKDILLLVDASQIVRVFENLISNAIKYSYKKEPIIVKLHDPDAQGYAMVTIENSIEGINDDEIDKMFERFYRLEKSRSSETGGSGLGLAISQSIVTNHGGKIFAEKKGDHTLIICVKLPVISI